MNKVDIRLDVIEFLSNTLSIPQHRFTDEASLFHDLGVDGDDAVELLAEFSKKFGVSLDGFDFVEYFGVEGSPTILGFFAEVLTNSNSKKLKRLEVNDFVRAAQNGEFCI
jgi:acyl carrier protein